MNQSAPSSPPPHRNGAEGAGRPPPQCRRRGSSSDGSGSSSRNHSHSSSSPQTRHHAPLPRPSTWHVFLVHFAAPMAILILVSNGAEIWGGMRSLIGSAAHHPSSSVPDVATKPSSLPTAAPPTSSTADSKKKPTASADSKYNDEVNAAIHRKEMKKKMKMKKDAATASGQKTDSQASNDGASSRRRQQQQQQQGAGPRSNPLYHQMEATIKAYRKQYEESEGTPLEHLAAMRYAGFLKYRDSTIHDGGTYQMEAIDVYNRAIELMEDMWRDMMARGEDTRKPADFEEMSGYRGLNRELFVDYDSKSIEGLLCAAHSSLGKVYFMSNMFDRAVQSYEECLSIDRDYLDSLTYRAQALLILGKYEEAGRDYRRVLEVDNDGLFVDAVSGLAKVVTAKEDAVPGGWDYLVKKLDKDLPRWTEVYEQVAKTSDNAGGIKHYADGLKRMHLAMFAYHDVKTKDAAEAWRHLSKGNEYKLSTVPPFDENGEIERVVRTKRVFTPDFFPRGIGSQTRAPIFIIGFVRSGSTLLERILDAHPLVVGTGEDSVFNGRLDTIRNEIVEASMSGDQGVLHRKVKQLADDVVADMISRWEVIDANMHRDDGEEEEKARGEQPRPTRFADKMLTNYYNVGFIHLLFPNALILHVAREPMDTIFSAFKHDFPAGGLDYTSEFRGLARLYHGYRDVMQHWDDILPGRVTHIRYEDMVTDLPNLAPRIMEAAGVPWDPTVLDFHRKRQAVNTLSTTQVRKGLYSHHFKGWRRYEEYLRPLLDLVGERVRYDMKTTVPGYVKADGDTMAQQ